MEDSVKGVLAALASIFFFGSFAVPMKLPTVLKAQIDPVIYQSYKSFACFATCWIVLLYTPLKFTWWGMVGALIWTITGVVAIIAVRLVGIGLAQSLWSGLSIFVSYLWGAYVFKEPISNHFLSVLALIIMAISMGGIGFSVSQEFSLERGASIKFQNHLTCGTQGTREVMTALIAKDTHDKDHTQNGKGKSQFVKGIFCASLVGILNGSFMIPLKYANKHVVGIEYVVSFGVGAMSMTTVLLAVYCLFRYLLGYSCPSFKFRNAAAPALVTGLFWSAGNFFSIYATLYLGVALGWPLVQCQLIVSAIWAVFYYEEVSSYWNSVLLIASSLFLLFAAVTLPWFGTVG